MKNATQQTKTMIKSFIYNNRNMNNNMNNKPMIIKNLIKTIHTITPSPIISRDTNNHANIIILWEEDTIDSIHQRITKLDDITNLILVNEKEAYFIQEPFTLDLLNQFLKFINHETVLYTTKDLFNWLSIRKPMRVIEFIYDS